MRWLRWILCFLGFGISFCAFGQLDASLVRKVDSIFRPWDKTNSPGCAIAILKDGKIIYEHGYGMSNLEYNIAISPRSVFHVASISKQFTAAAIQKLALEGKLSLNDDIRKFIPELPDFGHVITIANLMHHTSGLRDQWDLQAIAGWRETDVITEGDIMEMAKRQRGVNFTPGSDYLYCNTGFTLLGVAVKRVTGVSLRNYADSVFFKPLGMSSTVFHSDHSEIVVNRTSAYMETDDHRWAISIPVFDNYGATSLFTTVEDLAKWDENFYTHKVGGDAFIRAMQEPGVLNDGQQQAYASGLSIGEYRGNKIVEHAGADAGYRANFLRFPDLHFSVIVLANLANINPSRRCREVANLFLPVSAADVTKVVLLDSAIASKWAGRYYDEVSKAQAEISAEPTAGWPNATLRNYGGELRTLSSSDFVDPGGARFTFSDSAGVVGLVVRSKGMLDRHFVKLAPVAAGSVRFADFSGTYHCDDVATDVVISSNDRALLVKMPRQEEMELLPLGLDSFSGPFVVEFLRDKRRRVTGFLLSTGRSRNILFNLVSGKGEK